ncbi:hypothetical protein C8R42DRAFT_720579 [Lentinula raphanica]|nr:hypothetical protein C8R42DRAFT_720579 [Lentinula raphanica]
MSDERKTYERQKFNISLAEYLRRGLNPRDYATYKPKNLVPPSTSVASATGDPETELTPQQKARKEYEDRKPGEKKPENAWPNAGHPIRKASAIDKPGMRNDTAEYIAKNVGTVRTIVDQFDISKSGDLALLPVIVNVEMDVFSVPKTTLLRPEDYSS